jgi:hypothetical protein
MRLYLGVSVDVGNALHNGYVIIDLKKGLRETLSQLIRAAMDAERCSSGLAASMRGEFGWAATSSYGKCGRGCMAPLIRRQYRDEGEEMTAELSHCLDFRLQLLAVVPPRALDILPLRRKPLVIYSDASYAQASGRMGFVVFQVPPLLPLGFTADFPQSVLDSFERRDQQITPCEAFLGVVVPATISHLLVGTDLLWFVDNQAACSSLIKGSSTSGDVSTVVSFTHLAFAQLGCRAFFEFVESHANPSDGLSRQGLEDHWTVMQGWLLGEAVVPPWERLIQAPLGEWLNLIALG